MKKIFNLALAAFLLAAAAAPLTSCDSDDSPEVATASGDGVSDPSHEDTYVASHEGEEVVFSFNAAAKWTASTPDSWVTLLTTSGNKGASNIRISVPANTDKTNRLASIVISVNGYKSKHIFKIRQGDVVDASTLTDANKFIYDYMCEKYLWNEPIPSLSLTSTATYDKFFNSILTGIDALDHMNRDDGHWENGKREGFYSYITREVGSKSRAFEETEFGSGVVYCTAGYIDNSRSTIALIPLQVVPGTPAATAGIKRGSLITKVGGTALTQSNLNTLYSKLVNGSTTIETVEFTFNEQGQVSGLTSPTSTEIGSASFEDPSIYVSRVVTTTSGKKIGYLCYMYFDINYDNQLLEIFNQFKQQGIDELIIDLRYNGGGHVLSSTVLGTLIAGNAQKGQVYNHTTYNATRAAKGEEGKYYIGNSNTPERNYTKIADALNSSVNLNRVYVLTTVNTASASELIINGLRGLDIDVRQIGTTTNGKNVGMEVAQKKIGGYTYTITPITFYSQNAKGFRDYSNGFTPDVVIDEDEYLTGDWGTLDDPLFYMAVRWIEQGTKPSVSMSRATLPSIKHIAIPGAQSRKPGRLSGSLALPEAEL